MGSATSQLSATNIVNTIASVTVPYAPVALPSIYLQIWPTATDYYNRLLSLVPSTSVGTISSNIYKSVQGVTTVFSGTIPTTNVYWAIGTTDTNFPIYPFRVGIFTTLLSGNPAVPEVSGSFQGVIHTNFIVENTTDPRMVGYHLTNQVIAPSDASVTDKGINAASYYCEALFIEPLNPSNRFTADSNVTYSYSDLQPRMIFRGGSLTADRTDTFDTAATIVTEETFDMGSGTFKFYIQNIDPTYNISLSAPSGWTILNSTTIRPGYTGEFWVRVDTSGPSIQLYTAGIYNRNG